MGQASMAGSLATVCTHACSPLPQNHGVPGTAAPRLAVHRGDSLPMDSQQVLGETKHMGYWPGA